MANIATITINDDVRPAMIRFPMSRTDSQGIGYFTETRALVHMNHICSESACYLCELPEGTLYEIKSTDIRFLDSQDRFNEIAWDALQANRIESEGPELTN